LIVLREKKLDIYKDWETERREDNREEERITV
jgi:hypothetical protein